VLGVREAASDAPEVATEPGRASEAVGEIVGAVAERDMRWGDGAGDVEAASGVGALMEQRRLSTDWFAFDDSR
jgi:hypothetical protein